MSNDALAEAYEIIYHKWNKECKASEKQKEKIEFHLQDKVCLIATIFELKEELDHLNSKLEGVTRYVRILVWNSMGGQDGKIHERNWVQL